MKKILNRISYFFSVCLFCALDIFLFDLVCIGKISKFNHIWVNVCPFDVDGEYLICMINYDIVFIAFILPIAFFMLFWLVRIYSKQVLLVPFLGFLLFVLSIITYWGFV